MACTCDAWALDRTQARVKTLSAWPTSSSRCGPCGAASAGNTSSRIASECQTSCGSCSCARRIPHKRGARSLSSSLAWPWSDSVVGRGTLGQVPRWSRCEFRETRWALEESVRSCIGSSPAAVEGLRSRGRRTLGEPSVIAMITGVSSRERFSTTGKGLRKRSRDAAARGASRPYQGC